MIDRVASLLKIQKPEMNRGYLIASGTVVPDDETDGYQTGCIFFHTDGGAETAAYINEGSVTSCDFNAIKASQIEIGTLAYTSGYMLVADGDSYEETDDIALPGTGSFALGTTTDGAGVLMTGDKSKAMGVYAELETDAGSGVMVRPIRSRLRVDVGGNVEAETYGLQGQLCVYNSNLGHWHAGVLGTLERSSGTAKVYNPLAGAAGVIGRPGGAWTVDGGSFLAGVIALASATVTLTSGDYIGFYATNTSGSTEFEYGLYVESASVAGVLITDDSTDGVSITGACADGIHVSGACTANAIHISGNQAVGILFDVDDDATDGLKMSVDSGKTLTEGIEISGAGTVTTGINLTPTAGTTGVSIGSGFTTALAAATKIVVSPSTTGVFLDFELETEWTQGTLIRADFGSSTTLGGSTVGVALDLGTNIVATSEQSVTGVKVTLPQSTNDAASPALVGFEVAVSGAMTAVTSGDPTYTGIKVVTPAIDCTLDTIVSTGVEVTTGQCTQTGGTATSTAFKATGGTLTSGSAYGLALDGEFTDAINIGSGVTSTRGIFIEGECMDMLKFEGSHTTRRYMLLKQTLTARHGDASDDSFWGIYLHQTHQIDASTAHFIGLASFLNNDSGDVFQQVNIEASLACSASANRLAAFHAEMNVTAAPSASGAAWGDTGMRYIGALIRQNPANDQEGEAAIAIDDDWNAGIWMDPSELTHVIKFQAASGSVVAKVAEVAGTDTSHYILIDIAGVDHYIPVYSALWSG